MVKVLKSVFMFIGMIVGAGFATGRELVLFFSGKNVTTLIVAGVFMGLSFALFQVIARSGVYQYMKNTIMGKIVSCIMGISVILGFVVMTSGAEELLFEVFGLRFLGVLTGVITALIVPFGMKRVKNINFFIVPLLIFLIIYITYGKNERINGDFSLLTGINYVGLNMLMAGYLILEEGEKPKNSEILLSSILVSVIFSLLLILLFSGARIYENASMPIYLLALQKGAGAVGGVIIFLSIFSTLLGDAKLIFDNTYMIVSYKFIAIIFIFILSLISHFINFKSAVDIVYRIEGIVGVIFICYAQATYFYFRIRDKMSSKKCRTMSNFVMKR